jgi:hypothetical protein
MMNMTTVVKMGMRMTPISLLLGRLLAILMLLRMEPLALLLGRLRAILMMRMELLLLAYRRVRWRGFSVRPDVYLTTAWLLFRES